MNESIVVEVLKMLRSIEAKQDTLAETINTQISTLHDHMHNEERDWTEIKESLACLAGGFPDDDPPGHAKYHKDQMRMVEEKALFWKKMREDITKWGLIGVLGFLLVAVGDHVIDLVRTKIAVVK